MNKEKIAADYFKNGFNCAQSVLISYKNESNLNENDLLRISCALGAGMGRLQETCGAVTGAYLVIGLKCGNYKNDDNESKEKTYKLVRDFEAEFKKIYKTTKCKELLNCDLLTDEGKEYFNNNKLLENVCVKCVEESVKILKKILNKNNM